jgi:hypothetical protein
VDLDTVERVVEKARMEIDALIEMHGRNAMDQAVQAGASKQSAEFINQLRLDTGAFEIKTDSGRTDFSEPPRPHLPHLLQNAKPMKDGSGVYKVIPVGKPGNKPDFTTNIMDAQRRINAERMTEARTRAKAMAPRGSVSFRVATSKQDPTTQWVQPGKDADFTSDLNDINQYLRDVLDEGIRDIITGYLDMY